MSVSKVSPRPAAVNPRGRQILVALAVLVAIVLAIRIFAPHENKYEKLAYDVTVALQANNIDEVKKYQNAETATTVTRGVVGRAADALAPLGKLKSVKETTPSDPAAQTHDFDLTFDKGSIHEKIKVDPDIKIVHFRYQRATP